MSYILEALKKAEAERRSGHAPSIHTPHSFAPAGAARPWWRHPAAWAGVAVLLAAAGAAGWQLMRDPAPPAQVAAAAVPAAAAPAAPAAPASPAAVPAAPPPTAAARPPAVEAPPAPPPREPKVAAKPEPKAERKPEPRPKPRKEEEAKAPAAVARAPEADKPPPPLRELPEHIQREIPPLQIGGYIYSPVPADRSVLINKRLLREGDEIAPGLTLEKMTQSGMVLNYRGHRYRSAY
ncbi:general secretion pathway protein GspB [Noviherbaspirillum aridicola]|uniref:Type II secretion system protein GspB C-terminal domain-containing protein n=1 Tax=Noviherbaspirillum aridicola TaxID=2849687 RepID=A0ABQ4PYZ3_9BURK|nr:general secretion pathway protein GspB [Noviherbaspirillum aridicola]GIZ50036.1 hypothetical protein NCCP691_00500 [Noviherbaspirillum aridicola]